MDIEVKQNLEIFRRLSVFFPDIELIHMPCRAPCPALPCPEGRAGQKKNYDSLSGQDRARYSRAPGQGRAKKSAL
jgi:hypothetical protein